MSGLIGLVGQGRRNRRAVLDIMSGAAPAGVADAHAAWLSEDGCAAFSVQRRPQVPSPVDYAHDPRTGLFCAMDGVVWPLGPRPVGGCAGEPASHLLRGYQSQGLPFLRGLGGCFNVAWWDPAERTLTLATDRSGYRQLHYAALGGEMLFSTWLGPVLAALEPRPSFDPESLADFFAYRFLPGDRTLYSGVEILPPGGFLRFSNGSVSTGRYWRIDEIEPDGRYDESVRGRLDQALRRAVRRCASTDGRTVIALTGGLDSRGLLAAALAEGLDVDTLTEGAPDSTDLSLARDVAALAGVRHEFEETHPDDLGDLVRLWVEVTGASAPDLKPHSCESALQSPSSDRVMTGIVGNVCRHAAVWRLPDAPLGPILDLATTVAQNSTSKRMQASDLWLPHLRDMADKAPREHLAAVFRSYDLAHRPLKLAAYMSIQHSGRRGLGRATIAHGLGRETGNPFLDPDLLDVLLSLPVRERMSNPIQLELIGMHAPRLLDIPFNKEKGPFVRSDLHLQLHQQSRKLVRRLRRRMGSPAPKEVPAFPYQTWHGGPMRQAIEPRIRNSDALWRRYLDPERVEPLVEQHLSGERAWHYLVSGLTILEVAGELWGG